MLNVKGIMVMVRNAGIAWDITPQSISMACDIINTPTRMETGAVLLGKWVEKVGKVKRVC